MFKTIRPPAVIAPPTPLIEGEQPATPVEPPNPGFFKFPDDPNKESNPELCRGMIATVYWMKGHFMVILQCKGSQYCIIDSFREVSATQQPERRETIAIANYFQVPYNENSHEAQSNCCISWV